MVVRVLLVVDNVSHCALQLLCGILVIDLVSLWHQR